MKILMLAPEEFFDETGTPFSVHNRAAVLGGLGHEIDLVVYPLGKDKQIPNTRIVRIPRPPFLKAIKVGPSFWKFPLDFLLVLRALRLLVTNKYDVIHSHEEASIPATVFKKIFRIPHVYDMHSSLPQQLINYQFTSSRFWIGLMAVLERWTLRNADRVIVVCPDLFDTARQIIPESRIHLIENVPLQEEISEPAPGALQSMRQKHGFAPGRTIVYTGNLEPYQGVDILVDAMAIVVREFPEAKLVLVGGKPEHIPAIRARVSTGGLENNIVLTGMRPYEEMPLYLHLADILVSPRSEGTNTPLKIYEYMKSGKPIVATDLLTHTQVLDPDIAILTGCSAGAMAEGLLCALRDPGNAARKAAAARRVADTKYSLQGFIEKIGGVYSALGGAQPSGDETRV